MLKRFQLLLALLPLLLCAGGFGVVSAANYTITEAQLTALEQKLNVLKTDNSELMNQQMQLNSELKTAKMHLQESKNQIQILNNQLIESKREVITLKESSSEMQGLLKNAEKSLQTYEKTEKAKNDRIKWLQIALAGVAVYALTK